MFNLSPYGAGIVIYVKENIQYRLCAELVYELNNVIMIDILNGPGRGKWVCVYHSPNTSYSVFLERLELLFEEHLITTLPVRVIGDFNINFHHTVTHVYKTRFLLLTLKYDVKQIVRDYTHCQRGTKTMIDLLFTSDRCLTVEVSKDNNIADHCDLYVIKSVERSERTKKTITDRRLLYTSDNLIARFCEKYEDTIAFSNVNSRVAYTNDLIEKSVQEMIRYNDVYVSYSRKWYNDKL